MNVSRLSPLVGASELAGAAWVEERTASGLISIDLDTLCSLNAIVRSLPHSGLREVNVVVRNPFTRLCRTPLACDVFPLLSAHLEWQRGLNALQLPIVARAGLLGVALASIHPFPDGNGRTMRVAMGALLLAGGCKYVGGERLSPWLKTHRDDYISTVVAAVLGEPLPFVTLLARAAGQLMELPLSEMP